MGGCARRHRWSRPGTLAPCSWGPSPVATGSPVHTTVLSKVTTYRPRLLGSLPGPLSLCHLPHLAAPLPHVPLRPCPRRGWPGGWMGLLTVLERFCMEWSWVWMPGGHWPPSLEHACGHVCACVYVSTGGGEGVGAGPHGGRGPPVWGESRGELLAGGGGRWG